MPCGAVLSNCLASLVLVVVAFCCFWLLSPPSFSLPPIFCALYWFVSRESVSAVLVVCSGGATIGLYRVINSREGTRFRRSGRCLEPLVSVDSVLRGSQIFFNCVRFSWEIPWCCLGFVLLVVLRLNATVLIRFGWSGRPHGPTNHGPSPRWRRNIPRSQQLLLSCSCTDNLMWFMEENYSWWFQA
jgi:hypothetical protein